jgi:hypothetical protein
MVTTYTLTCGPVAKIAHQEITGQGWPCHVRTRTRRGERQYLLITEAPDTVASALTPGGLPVGRISRHGQYRIDVAAWDGEAWL